MSNSTLHFTGPTALGLLAVGGAIALSETNPERVFLIKALWFEGFALIGIPISLLIGIDALIIGLAFVCLVGLAVVGVAGLPLLT